MKKRKASKQRKRHKKTKMTNNLSICIVGKDKGKFLEECIDSCQKLSQHVAYLDLGSADRSIDIAKQKGITLANNGHSSILAEKLLDENLKTDWIIFLKPDEKLIFQSDIQLDKLLGSGSAKGYSLVVKTAIEPEMLKNYPWMAVSDPFKHSMSSRYVSTVEVRLVGRQYFGRLLRLMVTWSKEDLFTFNSQILKEVQIHPCELNGDLKENTSAKKNKEKEMRYLKGEISFDPEKEDNMWELGDDYIVFSVLTKEDLSRYYKGLSMGFGSERMYLTMLHNLGKFGRYEEARGFFETWKDKWEFFDTPEPYKVGGIIYANLFDLDKAVSCFEKYMELATENRLAEPLSLLAKVYLLQGKKEKVISLLKRSLKLRDDAFDEMVIQAISNDKWKPARLSICMIAREEEPNIGRALESVSGIADEIIVVDTGSADNTKEIAKKLNAKIIDALWENNFSKVRNLGLQEATGDYILCLDADEFIDARQRIHLALFKQILPVEKDIAFRVRIEPEEEDEEMAVMLRLPKSHQIVDSVRLFPVDKEIRFEGSAYESVDNSVSSSGINIEASDIFKITHANTERKERDLRKEIAVHDAFGSISDPEIALRGIIYFLRLGKPDTAIRWLEKADMENPRLLAKIVGLCINLGRATKVAKIINKAMEKFPESMELKLSGAEIMFIDAKYEEVCNLFEYRFEVARKTLDRKDGAKASYLYGMALLEIGAIEKGVELLIDARDMNPWNTRYKMGGIYALARCGHWEGAVEAVSNLMRDEGLYFNLTIDNFADLGIVFSRLSQLFFGKNEKESADLCHKIVEDIIDNRLTNKADIDKLTKFLNDPDKFWEEKKHA